MRENRLNRVREKRIGRECERDSVCTGECKRSKVQKKTRESWLVENLDPPNVLFSCQNSTNSHVIFFSFDSRRKNRKNRNFL